MVHAVVPIFVWLHLVHVVEVEVVEGVWLDCLLVLVGE